jgi:hypothetical protein
MFVGVKWKVGEEREIERERINHGGARGVYLMHVSEWS